VHQVLPQGGGCGKRYYHCSQRLVCSGRSLLCFSLSWLCLRRSAKGFLQACGKAGEKCHCDPQCELDNDCCHDYYTQCKKEGNPFKTPVEWDEWEVYQFLLDYFEPKPSPATPAAGTVVARLPEYMLVAFDKLAKLKAC